MARKKRPDIHTISMLVANKPGVLVRIAQTFARRGFNIDSLVVSPAVNADYSRMTITAQGDPGTLEQIIKQANKLIDVVHAGEHREEDSVHSELALMKVKYTAATKPIISRLIKKFRTRILDDSDNTLLIEHVGKTTVLDDLEDLLRKYKILEMVRTGKVAVIRGHEET